jgi:hypothetical protein
MPRRLCSGLLPVLALLFATGLLPASTRAQEQGGFRVQVNSAVGSFPEAITFHLIAEIPAPADFIELEYSVDRSACTRTSVRAVAEILDDGQDSGQVEAEWVWDLYRFGALPPGARLWWRWQVKTAGGKTWTTPQSWFTFEDDRHAWQTLTQGQITVHWYEGGRSFGQEMLGAGVTAQARLTADPGAELAEPVHVYFYADADTLQEAVLFTQQWTGGLAFTDFYILLIAADPQTSDYGRSTIAHELMHLVVHQLAYGCSGDIPRWLDEGLATWAEGDLTPGQQQALDEAIAENGLFPLRSLNSSFSAHASRAHLAYAQSYSVVVFLLDEYGRDAMLQLLAVFRQGASYDGALQQIYGFDVDGLEARWRASIGASPRPTAANPGTSTPVPTLGLWSGAPTGQPATATPTVRLTLTPRPSDTAQPTATITPTPTQPPATAIAAASPQPTPTMRVAAPPTPIGGSVKQGSVPGWVWYLAGGGAAVLVLLGIVVLLMRHR